MFAYGEYTMEYMVNQTELAMEQLAIKDTELEQEKEARIKAEKEAEEQRQYSLILKELAINDQKRPLDERIFRLQRLMLVTIDLKLVVSRVWINLNLDFQVIMVDLPLTICGTIQTYSK